MKNITTFDFNDLSRFDKIFVLVSGGIDSTYLYEMIYPLFPDKTYAVNCWNPYEQSEALKQFQSKPNFIEVRPENLNYKEVLINAFKKIPEAEEARRRGKYNKKIFPCCYYMKHTAFKRDPLFKEPNTIVISGIKRGDGTQRRIWLTQLSKGKEPLNHSLGTPTFFHRHKEGQVYCYPFRDYTKSELPDKIIITLKTRYLKLRHSGCSLCPVLVVFRDIIKDEPRVIQSVKFYNKLINQKTLDFFK